MLAGANRSPMVSGQCYRRSPVPVRCRPSPACVSCPFQKRGSPHKLFVFQQFSSSIIDHSSEIVGLPPLHLLLLLIFCICDCRPSEQILSFLTRVFRAFSAKCRNRIPRFSLISPLAAPMPGESSWSFTLTPPQRPPRTSAAFARERGAPARVESLCTSRTHLSTGSFLTSCARVEISPDTTVPVESLSTERSSLTRTSSRSTMALVSCPWQMLA